MTETEMKDIIHKYPSKFFPNLELEGREVDIGLRKRADFIFKDKSGIKVIVEVKKQETRDIAGQLGEYYGILRQKFPKEKFRLIFCAPQVLEERKLYLNEIGIECQTINEDLIESFAKEDNYKLVESYKTDKRGNIYDKRLTTGEIMEFEEKTQRHGDLTRGFLTHWSRGDYKKPVETSYFSIHWEIKEPKNNVVHFHVESPRNSQNLKLNDFKKRLINYILKDENIKESFQKYHYNFSIGSRLSEKAIEKYKSTGLFKIVLRSDQLSKEHWENIAKIHMVVGKLLDKSYMKIKSDLDNTK